jgi:intein-encoded DNA endonuclease-like protein
VGVPKGCKVRQCFLVPLWIKENREFCRHYLKIAFDCEGSIWLENQPKIRFGIFKVEEYMGNNVQFVEEIKDMLNMFSIESTKTWVMDGNKRKDGKITKGLYFKIRQKSLAQFAKEVGFSDNFKKQRLSQSLSYP